MAEVAQTIWTRKDLIGIEELSREEIENFVALVPDLLLQLGRQLSQGLAVHQLNGGLLAPSSLAA